MKRVGRGSFSRASSLNVTFGSIPQATIYPISYSSSSSRSKLSHQLPSTERLFLNAPTRRQYASNAGPDSPVESQKDQAVPPTQDQTELPRYLTNKNTILAEVDKALGRSKPPALEYILVNPPWFNNRFWAWFRGSTFAYSTGNPYGHAAIRYTMPDGEQKVMNIVGAKGKQMVNFLKPEDYLFEYPEGWSEFGAEQGGIWKRSFVTIRVEELAPEKVIAMDNFYKDLQMKSSDASVRQAGFSLFLSPIFNTLRKFIPGIVERGNCAVWTSRGMVHAGVIKSSTMWPKMIWVKTFLRYNLDFYINDLGGYFTFNPTKKLEKKLRRWKENMNIVTYQGINHHLEPKGALVTPLHWLWHDVQVWWNLEKFSNVIVKVPEGTRTALIEMQDPIWKSKAQVKAHQPNNTNEDK